MNRKDLLKLSYTELCAIANVREKDARKGRLTPEILIDHILFVDNEVEAMEVVSEWDKLI